MPRYGGYSAQEESVWTDVVSSLVAAGTGYAFASAAKLGGNPVFPLLGQAGAGVIGVGLKHLTDNPYLHESLEAMGYAGFGGLGWWAAETTTTIGGRPAGAPPFWHPGAGTPTPTSSSSASAAAMRALQALRANQAVNSRPVAASAVRRVPVPGQPSIAEAPYGYAFEAGVSSDSALSA